MRKITDAAPVVVVEHHDGLALLKAYKPKMHLRFNLYELSRQVRQVVRPCRADYARSVVIADGDIESGALIVGTSCLLPECGFSDLFNYDFPPHKRCALFRTERRKRISFCAYTRHWLAQFIEHMHQNATVAKWYENTDGTRFFAGADCRNVHPTHG